MPVSTRFYPGFCVAMEQATASASASAFRKKPVDLGSVPWSGRLEPADLGRPAGMLIAALMRCADERGLSLSDLASVMGVSYWTLSQLRIGFRRIEALDEDLASACARFLDRPELTIHMLAGLLDPLEALRGAALTPEDIVHARQLLASEPEELELLAPPNRARPLQAMAVDELGELHRLFGANPAVCEAVRGELACRPMSKTEVLRAAVSAGAAAPEAAPRTSAPAHGIMRCTCCQKRLRIPHLSGAGEIRCPACQTEYAVHWQAEVCVVQRQEVVADEPADEDDSEAGAGIAPGEAWSLLGLAPGSEWESVERARRSLLQQYHPDRLGHVSPLVQQLAENAFKRVNDAYEVLRAQR
jgi:transcriptional regulator with XRE-family HTH domain